jgi:hypothetical protein
MVRERWPNISPGGDRTVDLRIYFSTAYKYNALTDWATGASHVNVATFLESY